ncbi:MAG: hypothetical protein ACRDQA_25980 [Nocardioidaceae bacterium]
MIAHREAVAAALAADPDLAVYDGPPKTGEPLRKPPYVVVYVYTPFEDRTKLCGTTDETTVTAITHSVGGSIAAAEIVARNVRRNLLDATLTVGGWECWSIRHESGQPTRWDDTTGETVADTVDEWQYLAEPLPDLP